MSPEATPAEKAQDLEDEIYNALLALNAKPLLAKIREHGFQRWSDGNDSGLRDGMERQ